MKNYIPMETVVQDISPWRSLQEFFGAKSFLLYLIITTLLLTLLIEVLSLFYGINEYFPYFFLVPMFLVIFAFPKRGVVFTFVSGWIYLILVALFGSLSVRVVAVHMAWFFTYITLGVVFATYLERTRAKVERAERVYSSAVQQLETKMQKFENLYDDIRNPLQAIMLDSDTIPDSPEKEKILGQVVAIDKILDGMDKDSVELKRVREYLQKHYDVETAGDRVR